MKFFIDTAKLDEIREAHSLGLVDGVTTNPSLCAKIGIGTKEDFKKHDPRHLRVGAGSGERRSHGHRGQRPWWPRPGNWPRSMNGWRSRSP